MNGQMDSDAEHATETPEQRTIPVWKSTRDRAKEIKGDRTYEEFICELLDNYTAETRRSRR